MGLRASKSGQPRGPAARSGRYLRTSALVKQWQIRDSRFKRGTMLRRRARAENAPVTEYPEKLLKIGGRSLGRAYFIKSSTALVMALTPVRRVGSGMGAHRAECTPGSGTPVRWLSANFSESTAPSVNWQMGI